MIWKNDNRSLALLATVHMHTLYATLSTKSFPPVYHSLQSIIPSTCPLDLTTGSTPPLPSFSLSSTLCGYIALLVLLTAHCAPFTRQCRPASHQGRLCVGVLAALL